MISRLETISDFLKDTNQSLQTLFIESWCDDYRIIEENVRRVKISSPDVGRVLIGSCNNPNRAQYVGWTSEEAVKHYLARISARIPHFHTMEEKDLNYIKVSWPF